MLSNIALGALVAYLSHRMMSTKLMTTEMYTTLFLLILTIGVIVFRVVSKT